MTALQRLLFKVWVERCLGFFVANTSQIITDLTTAYGAIIAAQRTKAIAAAGPIMDLDGCMQKLINNANEMAELLNYILGGGMVTPTGGLTAPSGGVVQNTDANASTCYNLLVGLFQILK